MNSDREREAVGRVADVGQMPISAASMPFTSDRENPFFGLASSLEYPAEVELFQQGFPVREVYLVDKGLIKLIRLDEEGNELIVGLRSAGTILGAASAVVGKSHPVTAVTLTNCCLRSVTRIVFLDLARNSDGFSWHLNRLHSLEVYDQVSQLIGLKYLPARRRLEQLIWQLVQAMGLNELLKPLCLHLPLKYWEIAQLVAITPEYLSRVLKQLEEEGILFRRNGSLIILDPQRLYRSMDI